MQTVTSLADSYNTTDVFIQQCSRDHKEKLTLQDLMIMPVQRIPRYELILKVHYTKYLVTHISEQRKQCLKHRYINPDEES